MESSEQTITWLPTHCDALAPSSPADLSPPARPALLQRVLASLLEPLDAPHVLLLGGRGSGKSQLLRTLEQRIVGDTALHERWLPLRLSIDPDVPHSSADIWVACLELLLASLGQGAEGAAIQAALVALPGDDESRAKAALWSLGAWAERNRGLLLMIDNAHVVGGGGSAGLAGLSASLHGLPGLRLFATASSSPRGLEGFTHYRLQALGLDAARQLVLDLAQRLDQPRVTEALEAQPECFIALHALCAASPRRLAMLFQVLALQPGLAAERSFEGLLDLLTPGFQARLDGLAPQARQLVRALARAWDPCTAAQLAQRCGMDVNKASSQLVRLRRAGFVEKTSLHSSPRTGFQLADRTFALWCLACSDAAGRGWVAELVRFLAQPEQTMPAPARTRSSGRGLSVFRSRSWPMGAVDRAGLLVDEVTPGPKGDARKVAPELRAARWVDDLDGASPSADDPLGAKLTTLVADASSLAATVGWHDCRTTVQLLVVAGRGAEVLEALDLSGLERRWRPAYVAVRVATARSLDLLQDVAPELRAPALQVIKQLWPELVGS